jgi:hypothetical protein
MDPYQLAKKHTLKLSDQMTRKLLEAMIFAHPATETDGAFAIVLTGISLHFDVDRNAIEVAATDGKLLVEETIACEADAKLSWPASIVLKVKTANIREFRKLLKLTGAGRSPVQLEAMFAFDGVDGCRTLFTITTGTGMLTAPIRCIQSIYPAYRDALIPSCERRGQCLQMSAEDRGKPATDDHNRDYFMGLNPDYLRRLTECFADVTMDKKGPMRSLRWEFGRGIIVKPSDQQGRNRIALLMPMTLPE